MSVLLARAVAAVRERRLGGRRRGREVVVAPAAAGVVEVLVAAVVKRFLQLPEIDSSLINPPLGIWT